jgi:hypothetical protein
VSGIPEIKRGEVSAASSIRAIEVGSVPSPRVRLLATDEPGMGNQLYRVGNKTGLHYSLYEVDYFMCQSFISGCRLL